MALVGEVARLATLQSIVMKSSGTEREDEISTGELQAGNETRVGFVLRENELFVSVRFAYRTEPRALKVDAIFNLHYLLAEQTTNEAAEAFAQVNAVFNVWPYWRELVQSSAWRMAIGIPPVPLLKL